MRERRQVRKQGGTGGKHVQNFQEIHYRQLTDPQGRSSSGKGGVSKWKSPVSAADVCRSLRLPALLGLTRVPALGSALLPYICFAHPYFTLSLTAVLCRAVWRILLRICSCMSEENITCLTFNSAVPFNFSHQVMLVSPVHHLCFMS